MLEKMQTRRTDSGRLEFWRRLSMQMILFALAALLVGRGCLEVRRIDGDGITALVMVLVGLYLFCTACGWKTKGG